MKRQTEFNPLAFINSWKAGKKNNGTESQRETNGKDWWIFTSHWPRNDNDNDDDDVEHTSVNFRICVRTLFTSSMTLCMHK